MKNIQKYHIASFLDRRSHNWQQRICLITFLTLSLSVVVQGVPMHFFGWIGRSDTTLYAISALTWTWTLGVLVLFLLKRLSLKVAISAFGIMMQLAEKAPASSMLPWNASKGSKRRFCSIRSYRLPLSSIWSWLPSATCLPSLRP